MAPRIQEPLLFPSLLFLLNAAGRASGQQTPEFFQLPASPPEQPEQTQSAIYSAPVSRQVGSGMGVPTSPRSVTLTAAEREAAAMSGISETQYARNKLLMLQRQARGESQR